ncbi:MAG: polysaccharide deacetylase family protein, partial [Bdellovibrionales bacterium]|nr:polysaccharide deacetylase family protein [Bdellovibrionales bacterium]
AGHDLASHSYDHAQLTKVGPAALEKQIGGSKKIIEAKLGKPVKLFRLPYGAGVSVASVRAKIAEHGMVHVFWNVDTLDWQDKNPTSIFNRTVKQMNASAKNNGVVLFHDIHAQSVTASTMLMDYFIKQKINVCTVQAVVDQLNQGLASCQP